MLQHRELTNWGRTGFTFVTQVRPGRQSPGVVRFTARFRNLWYRRRFSPCAKRSLHIPVSSSPFGHLRSIIYLSIGRGGRHCMALSSMTGDTTEHSDLRSLFIDLLQKQGSSQHPHQQRLKADGVIGLNSALLDAVHHIVLIHGRFPGLFEEARRNSPPSAEHFGWLRALAAGFSRERLMLAQLLAHSPSTPAQPTSIEGQLSFEAFGRDILALSRSERPGCALGAAFALALDWASIRAVLDRASALFEYSAPPTSMPSDEQIFENLAHVDPDLERAMLFGAKELLLRHERLWAMLEARHWARCRPTS